MHSYASDHIPNFNKITTYPNDPEYNPNTNGVTNFGYAFFDMHQCKDTIGSIMNRFDWNSCTDMSYAFMLCYNLTGSIPNIPNSVTDIDFAFAQCYNLTGSIPNIPNSVTNMYSAFMLCRNLTGNIPNIPDSVTDMSRTFYFCFNLTGSIPNIPNSVTNMREAFSNCSNLSSSNVYIHSNNVSNAINCFHNMRNTMNIYVHAGTKTYNTFYKAMGNSTYNSNWLANLKTF